MNRESKIIETLKKEMNLEVHSTKCISLFQKYIKIYERHAQIIKKDDSEQGNEYVCYIEEYDDYGFQLSFMRIKPDLDTGWGDVFGRVNGGDFFDKREFLPWDRLQEIKEITSKKHDVDMDDVEDWFDLIGLPMDDIVEAWLCFCWQEANKKQNTSYPCYKVHHDDPFDTALNLLDGDLYDLEKDLE